MTIRMRRAHEKLDVALVGCVLSNAVERAPSLDLASLCTSRNLASNIRQDPEMSAARNSVEASKMHFPWSFAFKIACVSILWLTTVFGACFQREQMTMATY